MAQIYFANLNDSFMKWNDKNAKLTGKTYINNEHNSNKDNDNEDGDNDDDDDDDDNMMMIKIIIIHIQVNNIFLISTTINIKIMIK